MRTIMVAGIVFEAWIILRRERHERRRTDMAA
jgi:hypothetical protein